MKVRYALVLALILFLAIGATMALLARGCQIPSPLGSSFRELKVSVIAEIVDENGASLDDVGVSIFESTGSLVTFRDSVSKRFILASKKATVNGTGYSYMQLTFSKDGRRSVIINVKNSGNHRVVVTLRPATHPDEEREVLSF